MANREYTAEQREQFQRADRLMGLADGTTEGAVDYVLGLPDEPAPVCPYCLGQPGRAVWAPAEARIMWDGCGPCKSAARVAARR